MNKKMVLCASGETVVNFKDWNGVREVDNVVERRDNSGSIAVKRRWNQRGRVTQGKQWSAGSVKQKARKDGWKKARIAECM